jgi:hypothetical protein
MSAYREPGRDVDATDIERTKIHEAAETERARIAAREKTRQEAVKARDTMGFILTRLFAGCVALMLIGALWHTTDSYLIRKYPVPADAPANTCHDEVFGKGSNPQCPYAGQHLAQDADHWFCVCPAHAPAKDAGSPIGKTDDVPPALPANLVGAPSPVGGP